RDLDSVQKRLVLQRRRHRFGDVARLLARRLGAGQRAVALERRKVGTVGRLYRAQSGVEPGGREGAAQRGAERVLERDRRKILHCALHGARQPPEAVKPPASGRKRTPERLNASCSGVSSKPTKISKLAPDTSLFARGIIMRSISSCS